VKCDSAPETCDRCAKDGYDCPGYEKKTKWKVFTPAAMHKSRGHARASRQSSSDDSTSSTMSEKSVTFPEDKNLDHLGLATLPSSLILSSVEKEIIEIQSSVIYCKSYS